jgi:hypothetical protein
MKGTCHSGLTVNPPRKLVRLIPVHHDIARPQVADEGDGLHIWRVAANILNKQLRTADKR